MPKIYNNDEILKQSITFNYNGTPLVIYKGNEQETFITNWETIEYIKEGGEIIIRLANISKVHIPIRNKVTVLNIDCEKAEIQLFPDYKMDEPHIMSFVRLSDSSCGFYIVDRYFYNGKIPPLYYEVYTTNSMHSLCPLQTPLITSKKLDKVGINSYIFSDNLYKIINIDYKHGNVKVICCEEYPKENIIQHINIYDICNTPSIKVFYSDSYIFKDGTIYHNNSALNDDNLRTQLMLLYRLYELKNREVTRHNTDTMKSIINELKNIGISDLFKDCESDIIYIDKYDNTFKLNELINTFDTIEEKYNIGGNTNE